MNISIFYEKKDSLKTLKELSYNIGNVGVELKQFNENRQDIDIAENAYKICAENHKWEMRTNKVIEWMNLTV